MRAAVFQAPGQPLELRDVPDPEPGEGEVLLRVERCGICGTDLHMTEDHGGMAPSGFILGHERSAEVVALGKGVERLRIGDHVVPHPARGCGKCADCRAGSPYFCEQGAQLCFGGFAEYMIATDANCAILPATLSLADAAIIEPLAVGLLGIQRNPFPPGARLLVLGAGPIGIAATFWAKRAGAGKVAAVATSRTREPIARAVGVDAFFTIGESLADDLHAFFGGAPDVVIECAGVPGALANAIALVKPRGSVTVLGICEHADTWVPAQAILKEVKLQFAVGTHLSMFRHAADILDQGIVSPLAMVTDVVSFQQLPEIFEALKNRSSQCKVLLNPMLA